MTVWWGQLYYKSIRQTYVTCVKPLMNYSYTKEMCFWVVFHKNKRQEDAIGTEREGEFQNVQMTSGWLMVPWDCPRKMPALRFRSRGLTEISQPKNQGPKFCLVYKWISFPQDFEIKIFDKRNCSSWTLLIWAMKQKKHWLGYNCIGDEILPSYQGIIS